MLIIDLDLSKFFGFVDIVFFIHGYEKDKTFLRNNVERIIFLSRSLNNIELN